MKKPNLIESFSELLYRKYNSTCTINAYLSCAKKFINQTHPDAIDKLTEKYLLKYLTLYKMKYSVSAYNQLLSVLKIIYIVVLKQNKLINESTIKQYPQRKNLPSFESVNNKINGIKNIKHKAILKTLLVTGLRRSELLNIKIKDVNSDTMKIYVSKGKGGVANSVIMTNELLSLLRGYVKQFSPKEYLFEGVSGKYSATSLTNVVKKHIGKQYSPHWLRHIIITRVINKNIPTPKAKIFSRHKSDASINWYYNYDESVFDELRNAVV